MNTYSAYYQQDWERLGVSDATALQQFGVPTEGTAKTGTQLYAEVMKTVGVMPHLYLYLTRDSDYVRVAHRSMAFRSPMGQPAADWQDKVLLLGTDVISDQLPQVLAMPTQFFSLSAAAPGIKVPTVQALKLHFLADGEYPHPAVETAAPEGTYDRVQTRKSIYLPARFAGLVWGQTVTPATLFTNIHSAIADAGLDPAAYQPLVDWLRVACVQNGKGTLERSTPLVPLPSTTELVEKVRGVVRGDLPGWTQATPAAPEEADPAPGGGTNQALQALLVQLLQERVLPPAPPAEVAGPGDHTSEKTPGQHWKGTLDELLSYAQVGQEDQLPHIWTSLANCNKKEGRTVLQTAFRRFALREKLSKPLATVELLQMVQGLAFLSPDDDKLELGLQPFCATYVDQKTVAEQERLNVTHDLLLEGGVASLKDLLNIREMGKLPMPTNERQTRKTIQAFGVILGVLVGRRSSLYQAS